MANDVMAPRSRIALTYDTRQPDQARTEKELPLRLLILGDLKGRAWAAEPDPTAAAAAPPATAGTAGAAKTPPPKPDELEHRPIHNLNAFNLPDVMSKIGISLTLSDLENVIDPAGKPFSMTVPIDSLESFEPGSIVDLVPAAQNLLAVRKQVLELQGLLQNNKKFVRLVRELTRPENRTVLDDLRKAFAKNEAQLRVPPETKDTNGTH
jgi:type VI secretion system protein ImpB